MLLDKEIFYIPQLLETMCFILFTWLSEKTEPVKENETQAGDVETIKPDIKIDDFNNEVRQIKIMIMQIDIENDKDLDVSHLESDKANRIIDLIEQYSPKKQESFPVQMKIVLKDYDQ